MKGANSISTSTPLAPTRQGPRRGALLRITALGIGEEEVHEDPLPPYLYGLYLEDVPK
jgi:hypothetical protein